MNTKAKIQKKIFNIYLRIYYALCILFIKILIKSLNRLKITKVIL